MSVRIRLILAFLALSVIPLSAVTLYSYASSVKAFRAAVESESERMAMDLQGRLNTVTTDIGRQVGRLWEPGTGTAGVAHDGPESTAPDIRAMERIATMLGDSAKLLERVEYVPMPDAPRHRKPHGRGAPGASTGAGPAAAPDAPEPPAPPAPPPPGAPVLPDDAPMVIDVGVIMGEVQKELRAEGVPPEAAAQLKKLADTLGPTIAAGLQAAGAQVQVGAIEVSRALQAKARARAALARQRAEAERRAAMTGDALAVPVVRDGELVGSVSAQLNLPRTFAMVLGSAHASQGEIPFAIDADGALHAANPEHEPRLRALNVSSYRKTGVRQQDDWVIVTRDGPSSITFGIARPIAQSLKEIRRASVRSLFLGLGVIGLALVGIIPLSRHMTRNLTTLTDGVQRIAKGDFAARVPVKSSDEFGALAAAFNHMAEDVEKHQHLVVERERLQRELELCRRIQSEMLPHKPLRLGPTEVKGISIPAREVGGDFFNYFELPAGQVAVLVGDVSGKGISAALLMANIQATLRARLPLETDLAKLTGAIDQEIEASTPPGVYATLFIGILDPAERTLRYVNAGHHPQFVVRANALEPLGSGGMPVGLFAGHGYTERTVRLEADDLLFFYTDGLVEVENETGDMFGADRLEALLRADGRGGIDTLLERAEAGVLAFRGKAEPFDDLTMMALRLGVRSA